MKGIRPSYEYARSLTLETTLPSNAPGLDIYALARRYRPIAKPLRTPEDKAKLEALEQSMPSRKREDRTHLNLIERADKWARDISQQFEQRYGEPHQPLAAHNILAWREMIMADCLDIARKGRRVRRMGGDNEFRQFRAEDQGISDLVVSQLSSDGYDPYSWFDARRLKVPGTWRRDPTGRAPVLTFVAYAADELLIQEEALLEGLVEEERPSALLQLAHHLGRAEPNRGRGR